MASLVMLRNCARVSPFLRSGLIRSSCVLIKSLPAATSSNQKSEEFVAKNKALKRPMSPHLLIYKWEFHAMLSGSHRLTGFLMTIATTTFALCALGLPENLEHYVNIVKSFELPRPFIFTCKALLAFPVTYHGINGIRHLCWDMGKGFEWSTLIKTGSVVAVSAVASAIALAYYF
ncbi:succinate dehydrogenase cytochrome b560 subunit, mitochondrial [Exaiptasia diaphana]|uniref:Succinate dehydrogenase cytochrome b560 subunit, mitochondrial n=1 Tax=Exaiptasia diaphana TaxID=2652724 RepID=A0A913XCS4_EXADI|nr:succinate dehydrogenase cytochrome b560 subunit, mitochondrial [Exaiptasia diaphana]